MLVAKLIPMIVAGGITVHSGPAINERLQGLVAMKDGMVTRQRIMAIVQVARLDIASGDDVEMRGQREFRRYVRKNVRIKGGGKSDSSLDIWGKPLRGRIRGGKLRITSAGADKKFGTKDDVKIVENIFDY